MLAFREQTLTPADPDAFVTLADAKSFLGITDSASDTLLASLLSAAASAFEAYCDHIFTARTVVETIDLREAANVFLLRYAPIRSWTSLTYDGTAVSNTDLFVVERTGMIRYVEGTIFAKGRYVASYAGGYTTIPAAVTHATLLYVQDLYKGRRRDSAIMKEDIEDVGSVEYRRDMGRVTGAGGVRLPLAVADLLAPYKCEYPV